MGAITIGVDIGQKHDPTAICVAEGTDSNTDLWAVRHLERLPLATSYPDVAARLSEIVANVHALVAERAAEDARQQALRIVAWPGEVHTSSRRPSVTIYVDATGVGQPIVDELRRRKVYVTPCYFTHGDRRTQQADRSVSIGKAWLVSRLQALLQGRRLSIPARLPDAAALTDELLNYEIKIDENANDKYGAFKTGKHDDQVTAIGLAVQAPPPDYRIIY